MVPTEGPPIAIYSLEWFAAPLDLCRSLAGLWPDDTARSILTVNPGYPDAIFQWEAIGHKGGSEPGVVAVAWITEDADGRVFVTAGAVTNPDELLSEVELVIAFAGLRDAPT